MGHYVFQVKIICLRYVEPVCCGIHPQHLYTIHHIVHHTVHHAIHHIVHHIVSHIVHHTYITSYIRSYHMSESCDICPLYPHAYDCPLPSDCGMPRQLSVTAHSLNHCSQYGSVHAIAVPMSDCLLFLMYLLFILHLSSSVLIHSSSFLLILSLCKDVASSRHSCSQGHRFSPCFLSCSHI